MDSRSPPEVGGAVSNNVKECLSDKEIVGLCIDFMLAGYETTKNSMSYISYLLATNDDKQDILCTAIDEYYQENEVGIKIIVNNYITGISLFLRMLHCMMLVMISSILIGSLVRGSGCILLFQGLFMVLKV